MPLTGCWITRKHTPLQHVRVFFRMVTPQDGHSAGLDIILLPPSNLGPLPPPCAAIGGQRDGMCVLFFFDDLQACAADDAFHTPDKAKRQKKRCEKTNGQVPRDTSEAKGYQITARTPQTPKGHPILRSGNGQVARDTSEAKGPCKTPEEALEMTKGQVAQR